MADFRSTEELLAWLVDFIAVQFGSHAILKEGMAVRLGAALGRIASEL